MRDFARLTLAVVSGGPDAERAAIEALRARLQVLCRAHYAALLLMQEGRGVASVIDGAPRVPPGPPTPGAPGGADAQEGGLPTALPAEGERVGSDDRGCWFTYLLPLCGDDGCAEVAAPRQTYALLVLGWPRDRDGYAAAAGANAVLAALAPAAGAVIAAHLLAERVRTLDLGSDGLSSAGKGAGASDGWEQVFHAVSEPICVLTPDYRIVRANSAYARLFGLDPSHIAGRRCYAATRGREAPCDDCPLPQTLDMAGPAAGRQVRYLHAGPAGPEGRTLRRVFEVWTYPLLDTDGAVVRIVEILKDVTERERMREAQSEADVLRRADRLKSELLGTVSHELRSPLAAIKGYAATLRRHEERLSREERHEFLVAIDSASDRLARIIERLLEMSQLETGSLRLHVAPVDLVRTMRLALAAAEAEAGRVGDPPHIFVLRVLDDAGCSTEGPLLVEGDVRLLSEVAGDLVENAVKYSPDRGIVEITLRPADSPALGRAGMAARAGDSEEDDGAAPAHAGTPHVELVVRDAGIGIPPEHLSCIFEPFHRVDMRLTREADGLGLGLALSRRIVELHRGTIWAESEPGSGSAFHVLLPAADTAEIADNEDNISAGGA